MDERKNGKRKKKSNFRKKTTQNFFVWVLYSIERKMELYGVPTVAYYGQNERVDELNDRIQSRQFSDKPLAPNFSSRPLMSKYSHFPIIERRAPYEESIQAVPIHNVHTNFSPATQNGPPRGYLVNVDLESDLRNQSVALQRCSTQATYVPSSNSDLYKVEVPSTAGPNPHPGLFASNYETYSTFRQDYLPATIGNDTFHNHTRTQLRGL